MIIEHALELWPPCAQFPLVTAQVVLAGPLLQDLDLVALEAAFVWHWRFGVSADHVQWQKLAETCL